MSLYEELGKIQFQLDRFEQAKNNIKQQIEVQMALEIARSQEEIVKTAKGKK